jgi:hypothetical protein
MTEYSINSEWLQTVADHNRKIHSLARMIELVDSEKFEKDGIQYLIDTAGFIHELSDKIYEILKQIHFEVGLAGGNDNIADSQEINIRDSTVSISGGTHNHYSPG